MAKTIDLDAAVGVADRNARRALAVLSALVVFFVGVTLIAGLLGGAPVSWLAAILAGAVSMYGWYAAQKDNRDYESGKIVSVLSSTGKDIAVVALSIFAAASVLEGTNFAPFASVLGGGYAGLIAWYVGRRIWASFK